MKKPDIEAKPAPNFPQMGEKFWVDGTALTPKQIADRYESMMDALIGLVVMHRIHYGLDGAWDEEIDKGRQALRKAGVKFND